MNTTVTYQLVESQTTGLTTHRIKTRDDDSLRRIINDNFHTGGCLKRTDVSTLTTNDTAFYLIIVDMEYWHTVFYCCLSSHTLNGLDNNFLGLGIGIELRLVHDLVDITCSGSLGLVLHGLHQSGLSFLCAQTGNLFKHLTFFLLHFLQLLSLHAQEFLLIVYTLLLIVEFIFPASQLFLTLIQRKFTLLQFVLTLLDVLITLLHFLLQLCFLVQELLLHLQQFLLLNDLSLFRSCVNHLFVLPLDNIAEDKISTDTSQNESACGNQKYEK